MISKYDKIGQNYNLTRRGDKYIAERLAKLLNPKENSYYLDIGCGTGNYTNLLYSTSENLNFVGIDPSEEMLRQARNSYPHLTWQKGSAEANPLDTNSIDGAIGSLTIHHWSNPNAGFKELRRVLKKKKMEP